MPPHIRTSRGVLLVLLLCAILSCRADERLDVPSPRHTAASNSVPAIPRIGDSQPPPSTPNLRPSPISPPASPNPMPANSPVSQPPPSTPNLRPSPISPPASPNSMPSNSPIDLRFKQVGAPTEIKFSVSANGG